MDNFGKGTAVAGLNPGRAPKANGWGWRSIRPSRRVFNGGGSDPSNASLERAAIDDTLEDVVRCENCGGSGVISYNPNLNPNSFQCTATSKCTRCGGTGIEDTANASVSISGDEPEYAPGDC